MIYAAHKEFQNNYIIHIIIYTHLMQYCVYVLYLKIK